MRSAAYRQAAADAMSEDDLEAAVAALCKDLGVRYVHHRRSKGTTPGWPDDQLLGTGLIFAELKTETGKVSAAQADMLAALAAAGQRVYVWRPSDLISGVIAGALRSISPLLNRPQESIDARA